MKRDVIIACDFSSREATIEFLKKIKARKPYVKIGMELFYSEGPDMVRELKAEGYSVFLDLKLHDIPNTVRKSMRALGALGADMVNLHAAGGYEMMRAAREGLDEGSRGSSPLLIAVTQLTSTSQQMLESELLIREPMESVVAAYAENSRRAGADGVVCSPLESAAVKARCGAAFLTVTPGIRYASGTDDQTRITTPQRARELGSDFIVVGRPITAADDPDREYRRIAADFLGGEI